MCFTLCLVRKLTSRRTPFGSAASPTHATATAIHFPANADLIFLTDELTSDRYLVDTGATLSIVPCNQNSSPSSPLLKGAEGQPIPSWGFIQKLCNSKANFSHPISCKPLWPVPFWALTFVRKLGVTVVSEINQIQFACTAAASPAHNFFAIDSLVRLSFAAYSYTGTSSGSNLAACCDNFFPASCHIRTCSPEP